MTTWTRRAALASDRGGERMPVRRRTAVAHAALLLACAVPCAAQRVPEFVVGGGPVLPAVGTRLALPQASDDAGGSLNAALRWHIREVASVGLVVEWTRFHHVPPADYVGVAAEGARRYLGVGANVRRYATSSRTAPRGFVGVGLGVVSERFTQGAACGDAVPTDAGPCIVSDERGGWVGGEAGISLPVGQGLLLELSVTYSGVAGGLFPGMTGASAIDEAGWIGLRFSVGGALW